MENKYIIFKWRNCWQLIEFRCSVHRETIKIKDPILWFWSKANAPTQETAHTDGSVYIGNASICAPTFSIFLCPVSLLVSPYFIFSLSPPLTHWLFLFSLSFPLLPMLVLFLSFLHSPSILPPPPPPHSPPLHPSVSTRQSHPSSLGRHMCCFDSKGSDGARGRKAATPWQQRHIIGGKTHPTINYWSPSNSTNTLGISYCHCRLAQWSSITGEVLNQSAELILY